MAILHFTDSAREMALRFLAEGTGPPYHAVRVVVGRGERDAPQGSLFLVENGEVRADDCVFDGGGFTVAIDPLSAQLLENGRVDWIDVDGETGFEVVSPQLVPARRAGEDVSACGGCGGAA